MSRSLAKVCPNGLRHRPSHDQADQQWRDREAHRRHDPMERIVLPWSLPGTHQLTRTPARTGPGRTWRRACRIVTMLPVGAACLPAWQNWLPSLGRFRSRDKFVSRNNDVGLS